MEDGTPQTSDIQEAKSELKKVSKTLQQPLQKSSIDQQKTPELTPLKKSKKQMKIILIIIITLIGLGLGAFLFWKYIFTSKTSVPATRKTNEDTYIYKGVWMPSFGSSTIIPESYIPEGLIPQGYDMSIMEPVLADLDKAEEVGINTFAFQIGYYANDQGNLNLFPGEKEFFASFIDQAHARGFKVWLNPEIIYFREGVGASEMRIMPDELIENTNLIQNFENAIVETAKFAEEHNVEIFSPSSEMYANLDFEKPTREKSKKVIIDVKPRIDAVYHGKICLRGEWALPEFLPYYSCFGSGIAAPQSEQEKNQLINHLEQEKEKGVEIIIGEIYEGSDWNETQEEAKRNFEMALDAAKGRTNGVFILDSGRTYKPLFPESFEATIKEFYQDF